MKILTLFTLTGILLIGCSKDRLTASGDKITETRFPGEFNGVNTSGTNKVYISYGTEFKVELRGSNNLLSHFKTNVMSSTLYLGYENANVQHDDVEVFVTLPVVKKVAISGSGAVSIEGSFPVTNSFRLSISGSGETIVKSPFESDEVLVDISGSGMADLQKINCKKADIDVSGSGDARVTVQQNLKARISGSGKIYYTGNAEVDADVSGSGKVIKF
jgi:hypothetical protein